MVEACGVELEHTRVLFQLRQVKFLVTVKEQVVKFPEPALFRRAAGCFGHLLSVRVRRQWKILKGHGYLASEFLLEFLEFRIDSLAIGAFVVRELDDHNRSVPRSAPRSVVERHLGLRRRKSDVHACPATQGLEVSCAGLLQAELAKRSHDLLAYGRVRLVAPQA